MIECDFLLLDVKRGRTALAKRLRDGERVRVILIVELDNDPAAHGRDDGTSMEFGGRVTGLMEVAT